jgi:hypothetical protein
MLRDSVSNILDSNFCDDLKISKDYGFCQILNFKDFPDFSTIKGHILFDNSEVNYDSTKLTAREMFDYDIGDEFHTEYYDGYPFLPVNHKVFTINKILNKRISENSDTLRYDIEICEKAIHRYYSDISIRTRYDTTSYWFILSEYSY